MVIEILYNKRAGSLYCRHDGMVYSFEEIKIHVSDNGHEREVVGIGVPGMVEMKEALVVKSEISNIFDKKEGKDLSKLI